MYKTDAEVPAVLPYIYLQLKCLISIWILALKLLSNFVYSEAIQHSRDTSGYVKVTSATHSALHHQWSQAKLCNYKRSDLLESSLCNLGI